jgi:hypothetical protein
MHRANEWLLLCQVAPICLILVILGAGDVEADMDDLPRIDYIAPQSAREGEMFTLDIFAYVSMNLSHTNITFLGDHPYIQIDPVTGILTWTPTSRDLGDHFVTLTIIDDGYGYDKQMLKITVEDHSPIYYYPHQTTFILTQDALFKHQLPVHDWPYWEPSSMELTNDHKELFVVDPVTGVIYFTPRNEHVGNWTVSFSMVVGEYTDLLFDIDFLVVNRNDRPTLERPHGLVVREGEPVDISLQAHDPDMANRTDGHGGVVDPEEVLMYRTSLPHPLSFEQNGKMTWVPSDADAKRGNVTVYFDVRDRSLHGDAFSVTYHVVEVYHPPKVHIIGLVEGQKITDGKRVQVWAVVHGGEMDPRRDYQYRWYAGGVLIGDEQNMTWKAKGKGLTPLKVVVQDPKGRQAETTMNVTIKSDACPPPGTFGQMCLSFVYNLPTILLIVVIFIAIQGYRRRKAAGPLRGR